MKAYIIECKVTGYIHIVQAYSRDHVQAELNNLGLTNVYIRGARHGK
jgi:hypothetical protein